MTLVQSMDLIAQNTPVAFPSGSQLSHEGDGMQVEGQPPFPLVRPSLQDILH